MPPTLASAEAAVSQRSAGVRNTWNQRSQLSGGTCTLPGNERQMKNAITAMDMPMNANDMRHDASDAISTETGLPSTAPTDQPTISFASVGARSRSGMSMLSVAATCGV